MSENNFAPVAKPGVDQIAMYVPGKSAAPDGVKLHKLSSNESPLGAPQSARDALGNLANTLQDYPDGSATELRRRIGAVHGLNPDNIVCGAGSDELLSLLSQAYLSPGDEAIYTEHGFLMYRIAILASGGTPVVAPEKNETAQVDEILNRVTDKTRIVFLANPNNPTGTYLPIEEVRRLHAGLPLRTILVLDAAYAEYVSRNDYEAGIELVSANENVVMTRTFSKIFGMAALRIGWMYGPSSIVEVVNRIRGPFNVNSAALAAAEEAIGDKEHLAKCIAHNDEWIAKTTEALEEIGLRVTPSVGNFILVHFPDEDGRRASEADAYLSSKGYLLRAVAGYGFPNALRMSIGSAEANEGVIASLRGFMAGDVK
ncbi:MAG: histidinol-phosphate transaminase [Pseudomonadota bacterium]